MCSSAFHRLLIASFSACQIRVIKQLKWRLVDKNVEMSVLIERVSIWFVFKNWLIISCVKPMRYQIERSQVQMIDEENQLIIDEIN